jgi:hypothetical protein
MRKKTVMPKGKKTRHPLGISLIELLMGLAVSSIVILAFLSLFVIGQKTFYNQDARSSTVDNTRFPMNWLTKDINMATTVLPGPVTISGTNYSTSENCLILQVPGIDANGWIIDIDSHLDTIVYALDPEHPLWLRRIVDAEDGVSARVDTSRVVSDNIDSLIFGYLDAAETEVGSYDEAEVITVSFNSTRQGLGRTYQQGVTTSIKLRNRPIAGGP